MAPNSPNSSTATPLKQPYRRYPALVPLAVDVHELFTGDNPAGCVLGRRVDDLRV
jgi:hypothetical protein